MDGIFTVKVVSKAGVTSFLSAKMLDFFASPLGVGRQDGESGLFVPAAPQVRLWVKMADDKEHQFHDGVAYIMNSTGKTIDVINIDDAIKCREDYMYEILEDQAKAAEKAAQAA